MNQDIVLQERGVAQREGPAALASHEVVGAGEEVLLAHCGPRDLEGRLIGPAEAASLGRPDLAILVSDASGSLASRSGRSQAVSTRACTAGGLDGKLQSRNRWALEREMGFEPTT